MESYKVTLEGPAPWGFRLQGGKDFSMPLSISRVSAQLVVFNSLLPGHSTLFTVCQDPDAMRGTCCMKFQLSPGGKSELAGVSVGDWVLSIDGENTSSMTHIEAQNKIRSCTNNLALSLSKVAAPKAQKDMHELDNQGPKYNFAPSTALNKTAQPFGGSSMGQENAPPGVVTKPVTYNPPPPTYNVNTTSRAQHHNGNPPELKAQPQLNAAPPGLTAAALATYLMDDRHSLRMASHPAYLANDSSKKRLVEDTEDWQPRTGTAQSRSFRILAQLTDTDFMQDPDDEHTKRAREKFITELQSPRYTRLRDWHHDRSATSLNVFPEIGLSPPVVIQRRLPLAVSGTFVRYTWIRSQELRSGPVDVPDSGHGPAAQPPPAGPAVRPPWAVDPTFAERYAPDKTSTVLTKHSQPATLTPMQNRNSIVQAAQQPPESSARTPICYKCNKIIRGRYLVALGQYYHPEEFTCSQCRKVLEEGGFFEEKGSIFCPKCYDMRYAPNCAKCKKKITGEIMHALKMAWHVQCFVCAACRIPIRNQAFYMEDGRPYCEKDFEKMFGTKCRGCDFKIDAGDRFLEALGHSWHDTCFVCAVCQVNLEGKTFYSKKDKPLCKTHAFSPV